MDVSCVVSKELHIPKKYLKKTQRHDRVVAVVHRTWLKALVKAHELTDFIFHDCLSDDEIQLALHQTEDLGPSWQKLFIRVFDKKKEIVFPLPRSKVEGTATEQQLSYAQLLQYVSQTNHKNVWKDIYSKHQSIYKDGKTTTTECKHSEVPLSEYNCIMKEILSRVYGCSIIQLNTESYISSASSKKKYDVHSNILPTLCTVETENYFILLQQPFIPHSLQDCVTFSPAMLSKSHMRPLFIIYQLLQAMRCLHDRGLILGDITLSDILITDSLWIKVVPQLSCNIIPKESEEDSSCKNCTFRKMKSEDKKVKYTLSSYCKECADSLLKKQVLNFQNISFVDKDNCKNCSTKNIYDKDTSTKTESGLHGQTSLGDYANCENTHLPMKSLEELCEQWVKGNLSNFKYLMALNHLAGRRYGDPTCHYVMPWVTDFALRSGGNWRDLTRSKFRLNKGDRQLDLTYDTASGSSQVPHHVSDVLSEITYYVYMARRTPQSVLCKYVRTKWVPAEYPSSIQRLQEWTPDECIPEFFTDPHVFKSIHEDLTDLEVPPWASSVQDFIEKHMEALESIHVSERLHYWIDLTFGYKLSGSAAIKSKNVCLHLVDSHTTLRNTGVVQLFSHPHPQRINMSPYWGINAPKLHPPRKEKRSERASEDEGHSSGFEEDDQTSSSLSQPRSSPLALSRFLSRSRGSLLPPFCATEVETSGKDKDPQKATGQQLSANGSSVIILPRDYNPTAALQNVESFYSFLGRTFHHKVHSFSGTPSTGCKEEYKQLTANLRSRDMLILGCLVVELLMASKLHPFGSYSSLSFEERLNACLSVFKYANDSLPRYAKYAVSLLLQTDNFGNNIIPSATLPQQAQLADFIHYPPVNDQGLPPPSAHLLLQPLLFSVMFPFPRHFSVLYAFLQKFHDYSCVTNDLKSASSVEKIYGKDTDTLMKMNLFISKIGELKVQTTCDELAVLLLEIQSSFPESLDLIMPYIKELLEDPTTAVQAAWCLFDPVAKVLGPHKTMTLLLEPIVKLYEYGADDNTFASGSSNKHVKLYHRSFLLQLIVRLGLKIFLENFVTPLVEAVGGYRDIISTENGLSHQRGDLRNKTSNLKTCELEETAPVGTLSPLDEDSSGDSENKPNHTEDEEDGRKSPEQEGDEEPEVFVFETEDLGRQSPSGDPEVPLYNLMDHLEFNLPQPSGEGDDNVSLELAVDQQDGDVFPITSADEGTEIEEEDPVHNSQDEKEMEPNQNEITGNTAHTEQQASYCIPKIADDEGQIKDQKEERTRKSMGHYKVSDMSADSLLWLSHRLGPVLTSRHLSRNLLRMLTLCYLGKENLKSLPPGSPLETSDNSHVLNIANGKVVGDKNAAKVLECLTSIAGLYGEQLIVLQYLPHMGELITLCKRKLTANLEGGLIGCLALLRHIIPYLCDATLMDQLQDVILKTILNPAVRLVSTTRFVFPSGYLARTAVASKFIDAVYVLSLRIGCEMSRKNLTIPSLQRFFLAFDKAHGRKRNDDMNLVTRSTESKKESPLSVSKSLEDASYLEIRRDGSMAEWVVKGTPLQIAHVRLRDSDSADSYSPPPGCGSDNDQTQDQTRIQAIEELKNAFTPELAHKSYVSFLRYLGESVMEKTLKNEEFVKDLCFQYEQERQHSSYIGGPSNLQYLSDYLTSYNQPDTNRGASGSFGSNVSVVGNRIDLQRVDIPSLLPPTSSAEDIMTFISKKMENTKRHLHGNWLAYWEHEIGRAEKDTRFNFKQIKLQTFSGHSNSVRTIQALDNENSFLSGSRDKTVKLWSLRSEGDGSAVSHCQWTYTGHRKSVMAISFLESLRLAASCDSVVHLWDPFIGCVVGQPDSTRCPPINVLRAMPPPSTALLASTTDATLRIIDGRTCSFINELKVSMNPAGLIRCIAVGPEGYWVAVGHSSGNLTIIDIRTGMIMSAWKGHEGEVLQLVAANNNTIISSSLDQTVSAWNIIDGKLKFNMKGPTEPVHCLSIYNSELISGTTASRIGVHTAIDAEASFSSTRLRSDTFKGVLTAMAVLPLNRLLLLGSDNGNISLLC